MTEQKSVFVILENEETIYEKGSIRRDLFKNRVVGAASTEEIAVAVVKQFNDTLGREEKVPMLGTYKIYYSSLEQALMVSLSEPVHNKSKSGDLVDFKVTEIKPPDTRVHSSTPDIGPHDIITLTAPGFQNVVTVAESGSYSVGDKLALHVSDRSTWVASNGQLIQMRYVDYPDLNKPESYPKTMKGSASLSELSSLC